ncbi:alkaline phosphatase family protein [Neorhodopirellula pilleata]|uniref:2,3-bisphosphoglycerate-independent phosphoglycerate mutase n=1 Tax=Neorhodopirellula pilleata TaxID=2714738 RepID=A0A5C6A8U7_9BACT|nr:alkaline phosphatase family protein [Neorhodopirellula pilleata]TWT95748.1 2,3-bisphosphoglycerate-independent phosphoglycerate mutase [Neorhodopirellula pilleata]
MRHLILLFFVFSVPAFADNAPTSRLLVIGIDGCRPDALAAASTPNLDALIHAGAFTDKTQILGDRYRSSDTSSGPGWSSFLTGVWADKHGVNDNTFQGKNYKAFPHFFRLIKDRWPEARTGSFVDWEPIDTHVVEAADVRVVFPAKGASHYAECDILVAREARRFLLTDDPHVAMVYFGAVDETGHAHGFDPDVPEYVNAIETVDERVGEVVRAMMQRPNYANENWLVIASTDHGGKDNGHGGGHQVPEILTTFLLVSGQGSARGTIEEPTYVVDVAATGLAHLGVDLPKYMDGRKVGLADSNAAQKPAEETAAGLSISWEKNYLEVTGAAISSGPIRTHYVEAYCRPGSTDRDWHETVIPHESELVLVTDDGKRLELRDRLSDGVVVDHVITAGRDDVTFTVTAHNPTDTESQAHWAQPCMRVDGFTGTDIRDSRETYPPYIQKCFLILDGKLTRLPTEPWALKARYMPGQVYAPAAIDRNDVNPRPLSTLAPSAGLTGCYSANEKQILAVAWEPYQEVFQGVITCMHSDFRIGGLKPGETKTIRGKMYVVPANEAALLTRYQNDFLK